MAHCFETEIIQSRWFWHQSKRRSLSYLAAFWD